MLLSVRVYVCSHFPDKTAEDILTKLGKGIYYFATSTFPYIFRS